MRTWAGACLALLLRTTQAAAPPLPKFEDFGTADVLRGKPVEPKIVRARDRAFRTRIREGAASGPNFAGAFTIAEWGCGSSCVSIAVVNAKTGDVNNGPFHILGYGVVLDYADGRDEPLSYQLDSRLLMVRGCPEDRDCGEYFYEWNGATFRLIQKRSAHPTRH